MSNVIAPRNFSRTNGGFSLVELMVALTLGLLLTAAVGGLFYSNKQNYNQNTLIAELQDNVRFASEALSRDLEMAGFLGGMLDWSLLRDDNLPALAADCGPGLDGDPSGWAFDRGAIEFLNDASPGSAAAVYGCLAGGRFLAGTDVLSVRRASGKVTDQIETGGAQPNLINNGFYLRSNATVGALFFNGGNQANPTEGAPPNAPPYAFWEYYSRLYFVSPHTLDPGTGASTADGVPTLYRAYLASQASPSVLFEPLAEGVEDMQIAFGLDTDGDGAVNQYKTDPTPDEINQALTARIQLLVRSVTPDPGYTNNKIYNIFGKDDDGDGQIDENSSTPPQFDGVPKDDNFYRRIAYTTVILRNPNALQGFGP